VQFIEVKGGCFMENFNRVYVAFDTVEWDCGVDLDPEFVTTKSLPIQA
jgi:hypothetical protein